MKITEIISPQPIEEGWKEKLAGLGLAAGVGLAGWNLHNQNQPEPEIPAEISQLDVKPASKSAPGANSGREFRRMIISHATRAGVSGDELSQLLAQVGHETGGFKKMTEVGPQAYFRKYEPAHNPKMAKILGNTQAGDGFRYRGRGGLQITGRYNYTQANQYLTKYRDLIGSVNIVDNPDLVATDPTVNALVTMWYWKTRVKKHRGSFSDTPAVTKKINSAGAGLEDRLNRFEVERGHHRSLGLHADDAEADILYRSRLLSQNKAARSPKPVDGNQTAAKSTKKASPTPTPTQTRKTGGKPAGRGR